MLGMLPCCRYDGGGGWEVAWGWAQERSMGARAGDALVRDIQRMESARGIGTSAPPGTQVNSNDMPAGSGVCFKAG